MFMNAVPGLLLLTHYEQRGTKNYVLYNYIFSNVIFVN